MAEAMVYHRLWYTMWSRLRSGLWYTISLFCSSNLCHMVNHMWYTMGCGIPQPVVYHGGWFLVLGGGAGEGGREGGREGLSFKGPP